MIALVSSSYFFNPLKGGELFFSSSPPGLRTSCSLGLLLTRRRTAADRVAYAHVEIVVKSLVVNFLSFGHNSAPSSPIYMKLGGLFPTSLPELFKTLHDLQNMQKQFFFFVLLKHRNVYRPIVWDPIFGPNFRILDISSGQYIQFLMMNPILMSEISNSSV